MRQPLYKIIDEPRPSGLAQLAVNPVWPFLASMLSGAWLAWPWFALNAFAIGSARRNAQLLALAAAMVGVGALAVGLVVGRVMLKLPDRVDVYLFQLCVGLKLWVGYAVLTSQQRSFELYRYFGGLVRNGIVVVLAGALLGRTWLIDQLPQESLFHLGLLVALL